MKTPVLSITPLLAALSFGAFAADSFPTPERVSVQAIVTVRPVAGQPSQTLHTGDLTVIENKTNVPVTQLERLSGDLAGMQLFIFLDDSTRSSSLGTQLPELKKFVAALPPSTQVAIGYMRNGSYSLAQAFTADHAKAANALRLPISVPGENGSPYFALSDLVKRWPSQEPAIRRTVLMLTDGVDRYYATNSIIDDPYLDTAVHQASQRGINVYSIYLRGAGFYGRGLWSTNVAQSRLMQVSDRTGGFAYFQDLTDPVSIRPFLNDFDDRMAHQYRVTFEAAREKGSQPVKFQTEVPGWKVEGPTQIYLK